MYTLFFWHDLLVWWVLLSSCLIPNMRRCIHNCEGRSKIFSLVGLNRLTKFAALFKSGSVVQNDYSILFFSNGTPSLSFWGGLGSRPGLRQCQRIAQSTNQTRVHQVGPRQLLSPGSERVTVLLRSWLAREGIRSANIHPRGKEFWPAVIFQSLVEWAKRFFFSGSIT